MALQPPTTAPPSILERLLATDFGRRCVLDFVDTYMYLALVALSKWVHFGLYRAMKEDDTFSALVRLTRAANAWDPRQKQWKSRRVPFTSDKGTLMDAQKNLIIAKLRPRRIPNVWWGWSSRGDYLLNNSCLSSLESVEFSDRSLDGDSWGELRHRNISAFATMRHLRAVMLFPSLVACTRQLVSLSLSCATYLPECEFEGCLRRFRLWNEDDWMLNWCDLVAGLPPMLASSPLLEELTIELAESRFIGGRDVFSGIEKRCPRLCRVHLSSVQLVDGDLCNISRLPALESLTLDSVDDGRRLTATAVSHFFRHATQLRFVKLFNFPHQTRRTIEFLPRTMERLEISFSRTHNAPAQRLPCAAVRAIARTPFPRLRYLTIRGYDGSVGPVMSILRTHPRLSELIVVDCPNCPYATSYDKAYAALCRAHPGVLIVINPL